MPLLPSIHLIFSSRSKKLKTAVFYCALRSTFSLGLEILASYTNARIFDKSLGPVAF